MLLTSSLSIEEDKVVKRPNTLHLILPNTNKHVCLSAESNQEMTDWLVAIHRAAGINNSSSSSSSSSNNGSSNYSNINSSSSSSNNGLNNSGGGGTSARRGMNATIGNSMAGKGFNPLAPPPMR